MDVVLKIIIRSAFIAALCVLLSESKAAPLFNLGSAANWALLQVGDGTITQNIDMSNPQGGITGNVGVTSNGHIQGSGPAITGDLYLGNNASAQFSGTYTNNRPITGTTHLGSGAVVGPGSYSFTTVSDNPQALLNQARNDAINASNAANMLAATSSLSNITTSMTLFGTGVYYLNSLNLGNGQTLTLSGSATDQFVFNISSTFKLNGAQILLTGGLTEANVLFNYTGTSDIAFTGGGNAAELHGIILALNAKVSLSPGLVVGEIIGGKDISIVSGADVMHPPNQTVPENGSSVLLLGLSLMALGAFRFVLLRFARAKVVRRIG